MILVSLKAKTLNRPAGEIGGGIKMIIFKEWIEYDKDDRIKFYWEGYFLFGILPLFLRRIR
jgi:hypothetical protein